MLQRGAKGPGVTRSVGPVTRRLAELYRELTAREGELVVELSGGKG